MPHNDLATIASSQHKWLVQALILAIVLHALFLLIPAAEKPKAKIASRSALEMTLQKKPAPKVPKPAEPAEPEPIAKVMTQAPTLKKPSYRAKPPPKKATTASAPKVNTPPATVLEAEMPNLDLAVGVTKPAKPKPLILDYASVKHLVEEPEPQDAAIRSQEGSDKNKAIFGIWERQIRQKVERIGQQNFPRNDNGRPLFGLMQFRVVLNADGSIAALSLMRSSGDAKLDQDALQIIRIAAPFGPVPVELLDARRQIMLLRYYDFVDERNVRWKQ